jgi:hypothetical protein
MLNDAIKGGGLLVNAPACFCDPEPAEASQPKTE